MSNESLKNELANKENLLKKLETNTYQEDQILNNNIHPQNNKTINSNSNMTMRTSIEKYINRC